jgi:hypothetical protein
MPGKKSDECRGKVALALAHGETIAEAAAGAHVNERTVHRWLREDEHFNMLLNSIHEEMLEESMSLLVAAQKRAARRLIRLIGHRSPRIALQACRIALRWQNALNEKVQTRKAGYVEMLAEEEAAKKDAPAPQQYSEEDNIKLMQMLLRNGKNGSPEKN